MGHNKLPNKLSKFFYSPTDAQVNCLKNNFKIHIKIDMKKAPTCFGVITPTPGSALIVLAKVTFVKIANQNTSVCGDVVAYIMVPCCCVYVALFGSRPTTSEQCSIHTRTRTH